MEIGEAIRRIREMKGLTQCYIENATGIKREYLSKIENSELKNPTINTVKKIAEALETQVSELIAMTEESGGEVTAFSLDHQKLQELLDNARDGGYMNGLSTAIQAIQAVKKEAKQ